MTADLEKNVIFGHFTLLQILQPNEWIITFEVSWCHIMMISSHFKGFWEIQKNWSFRWPRTWRKMWFLDISHFCRFCSQMSELLHLRCPDVILWWFPAILRAFEKFKKIEVFDDRGPGEKCDFWTFHMYADFAAKWVNYYILGVLMSYYDDFQPFKGLLRNSKKLKFSMTADLEKNVIFGLFTCMQILQPNEWIITF